jgi:hypothetical protein
LKERNAEIPKPKHLPPPERLPAAQGFGRRGFAQAGQIPNKHPCLPAGRNVPNTKFPNEKVLNLDIGIWKLFGIWDLDIGIYRS